MKDMTFSYSETSDLFPKGTEVIYGFKVDFQNVRLCERLAGCGSDIRLSSLATAFIIDSDSHQRDKRAFVTSSHHHAGN